MADISCRSLTKIYPDGTLALRDLDLTIGDGQLAVLVGPSGCGKTTLLRLLAGLEEATRGSISLGGRVVTHLPPKQRDVAMVFQNYALYPHMSAYENMAYSLKIRREGKDAIRNKVTAAASTLGLREVMHKKPKHLSGGQRQRVAMGRAIVREPQVFLMDEPLSNLDAKLRIQMRGEIHRLQRSLGVTSVYVTHDQAEALTLGDVVAVMRDGLLQQIDTPEQLYEHPRTAFVAGFIGSPAMNMVIGRLERADGLVLSLGGNVLPVPEDVARGRPGLAQAVGREVLVGIRPEHIQDAAFTAHDPDRRVIVGKVDLRENLGSEIQLSFTMDVRTMSADAFGSAKRDQDADSDLEETAFTRDGSLLLARVDSRSQVREGDMLRAAIDTHSLYFFDLETGDAIERDAPGSDSREGSRDRPVEAV